MLYATDFCTNNIDRGLAYSDSAKKNHDSLAVLHSTDRTLSPLVMLQAVVTIAPFTENQVAALLDKYASWCVLTNDTECL